MKATSDKKNFSSFLHQLGNSKESVDKLLDSIKSR